MHENPILRRLLLNSPFPLLLFALLPGLLVVNRSMHLHLPLRFTTGTILADALCLMAIVAVRGLHHLLGWRGRMRYGAERTRPLCCLDLERPAARVRGDLEKAGFRFTGDGGYAEKGDLGYLGTSLMYGGLLLLLATGIWENLAQFSGTFIQGVGKPVPLDDRDLYNPLVAGPLSSVSGLPTLSVSQLNFTDQKNPKGSAGIALLSKDNRVVGEALLTAAGESCSYRGYDIFVAKLLVDAGLQVTTKNRDNKEVVLFKDPVKLSPLWKKEGDYSFYGTFTDGASLEGELFYSPEHNLFKVKMSRGGKKVLETEYPFQAVLHKTAGDYDLSFLAMGRWAEIHVVRRRHMALITAGGIIALTGLFMRMLFRPQRVWLEEGRAFVTGAKARRLVQGSD